MANKADDLDDEIKQTRLKIERTSSAMTEKLELLERRLRETVDKVKQNLDPRYQVARYPWPIFGGSVAVGFLLGYGRQRSPRRAEGVPAYVEEHDLNRRKWGSVQRSLQGEVAGLKGLAVGAVIKLIVSMLKQSLSRAYEGRHAAHHGNGGGPQERLDAGKY